MTITISELETKTLPELQDLAKDLEVTGYSRMKKHDLISRVLQAQTEQQGNIFGQGVLEIIDDGFGFLRGERYLPGQTTSTCRSRRFAASDCAPATGSPARCARRKTTRSTSACCGSKRSTAIDPETARRRPHFENLTPIFPLELINLETSAAHPVDPPAQPGRADRSRPARPDRLAAQGRQDDAAQGHRQRHHQPTMRTFT